MSESSQRDWRRAFLAALVLNVFLATALVALVALVYRSAGVWPFGGSSSALHPGLTAAERDGLRGALRAAAPRIGPLLDEARSAREASRELLRAPVLDRVAVEAALARSREVEGRLKVEVDSAILGYAATLPPERRVLVGDTVRPGRKMLDSARIAPDPR
jgi:uncharacterized membrane protein